MRAPPPNRRPPPASHSRGRRPRVDRELDAVGHRNPLRPHPRMVAAGPAAAVPAPLRQTENRALVAGRDAQDVEPAVDIDDLAGHRARQVAGEVDRRSADVLGGDVRAERRDLGERPVHLLEPGDPGGRQGADGSGADRVDPHAVGPEVGRKVADGCLEGGLGDPHHVVVVDDLLGAVVGQRDHARAGVHERPRLADERDERVGAARRAPARSPRATCRRSHPRGPHDGRRPGHGRGCRAGRRPRPISRGRPGSPRRTGRRTARRTSIRSRSRGAGRASRSGSRPS